MLFSKMIIHPLNSLFKSFQRTDALILKKKIYLMNQLIIKNGEDKTVHFQFTN